MTCRGGPASRKLKGVPEMDEPRTFRVFVSTIFQDLGIDFAELVDLVDEVVRVPPQARRGQDYVTVERIPQVGQRGGP